jgi:hypothetical protein
MAANKKIEAYNSIFDKCQHPYAKNSNVKGTLTNTPSQKSSVDASGKSLLEQLQDAERQEQQRRLQEQQAKPQPQPQKAARTLADCQRYALEHCSRTGCTSMNDFLPACMARHIDPGYGLE